MTNEDDDNISAYAIDTATGALTPVRGSPFATGKVPLYVTVDPAGKFLYVTNTQSGDVSGYSIDSAGSLTPVPGSTFRAGNTPAAITVDPSGKFVYVTDYSLNEIFAFTIEASGSLGPVSGSPFGPTGYEPSSIVVLGASE